VGILKKNSSVLVISDTHFPYCHKDTLDFLKALKDEYKPDRVIHIGDEIDGHSISFHNHDPDLLSPSDEFQQAIVHLKSLYKLFPKVDVIESNHGSLVYRKGKALGLPRNVFKSYREILEAPKGWRWHFDLTITLSDRTKAYFCHGKTASFGKLSQSMAMNTIQGHYHERFEIFYWASPSGLYWDMRVGCLINDKSLAFNYNNTNLKRPLIGTGMIIDGQPKLFPMILDKHGRWIGKLK
jgi:hypothetical protein